MATFSWPSLADMARLPDGFGPLVFLSWLASAHPNTPCRNMCSTTLHLEASTNLSLDGYGPVTALFHLFQLSVC
jgi:hypothetical protein